MINGTFQVRKKFKGNNSIKIARNQVEKIDRIEENA